MILVSLHPAGFVRTGDGVVTGQGEDLKFLGLLMDKVPPLPPHPTTTVPHTPSLIISDFIQSIGHDRSISLSFPPLISMQTRMDDNI